MKTCPVCKTEYDTKPIVAEGKEVCCNACAGYLEEIASRLNESESVDDHLSNTEMLVD